jgi:hypothetical protein
MSKKLICPLLQKYNHNMFILQATSIKVDLNTLAYFAAASMMKKVYYSDTKAHPSVVNVKKNFFILCFENLVQSTHQSLKYFQKERQKF